MYTFFCSVSVCVCVCARAKHKNIKFIKVYVVKRYIMHHIQMYFMFVGCVSVSLCVLVCA